MKEIKVKNLKVVVDDSSFRQPPKIVTEVTVAKKEIINEDGSVSYKIQKNKYLINVVHPNTKQVLFTKIVKNDNGIMDVMEEASKLKDELNLKIVECRNEYEALQLIESMEKDLVVTTWYKETKFIPKPKRGKNKLHTEKGIVEGDISKEDFARLEEMDLDKNVEVDAGLFELDRQLSKTIEKRAKKQAKKPKKVAKKAKIQKKVKVAKKSVQKSKKSVKKQKKGK